MEQELRDRQTAMEEALEIISEYQVITSQLLSEIENLQKKINSLSPHSQLQNLVEKN